MKKIQQPNTLPISFSVGIIILFLVLVISSTAIVIKSSSESELYKTILYANSQISEVSLITQKADSYYSEASFSYENQEYNNVQSNCRLARDYYLDASQRYNEIRSELEQSKSKDKLVDILSDSLKVFSEIQLNMFEVCEHFESASRYYNTYYNTNVPYDDSSWDMGSAEMDLMNEKIRLHDENVRKYNSLLGDFKTELKKRLE